EAGGVLLGRHIRDTCDIVVDLVSTPLPGDRQSRTRFFRARRRHQALIDQVWLVIDGACTYLGEWHTHPEVIPTPSLIDQFDWRRKLIVDRFSNCAFFVIVGTTAVCAWEGHQRRLLLHSLERSGGDVPNDASG
ncbi:MAG TPA: Mov34/MPN/PAD-1 family protein, partial [Thermomicrobiales bacterium]|nr:Mov34/MPN/PAD-1 family protein [Thermomicrobiales bacterium]